MQPLAELEENARIRSEVADILRELRLKNMENQFEAEEFAAKQNLEVNYSLKKKSCFNSFTYNCNEKYIHRMKKTYYMIRSKMI